MPTQVPWKLHVIQRTPEMGLDVVQDVEMTLVFFASISRISPTATSSHQAVPSSSRLLPEFENDVFHDFELHNPSISQPGSTIWPGMFGMFC